jgi:ABC-type multidrug transport system permease subunit
MKPGIVRQGWGEIQHLFVDDGNLAAFVVVLIALVAGAVKLLQVPPLWGGAVLVVGLAGILLESLQRASRTGKKR